VKAIQKAAFASAFVEMKTPYERSTDLMAQYVLIHKNVGKNSYKWWSKHAKSQKKQEYAANALEIRLLAYIPCPRGPNKSVAAFILGGS